MTSLLNPYVSFAGNAREAMDFYASVLGGTLTVNTYGEYGSPEAPGADKLMHAQLTTDLGFTLMGADAPPGTEPPSGSAITISLSGDDAEELRGYWAKLSEGGSVSVPLEKQMWGDEFGQCEDRYGVSWMVNIAGSATAPPD